MTYKYSHILFPDIIIEDEAWHKIENLEQLVQEACIALIDYMNLSHYFNNADFSILLTNDAHIKNLNQEYRNKNQATNVLSFPAEELNYLEPDKMKILQDSSVGDVVIAFETIVKEAEEQNTSFNDHFKHLLIHSMLHLLGFDHENDKDAEFMEMTEIKILEQMNIKSPYA
jgi:probable rRNA maturation factor